MDYRTVNIHNPPSIIKKNPYFADFLGLCEFLLTDLKIARIFWMCGTGEPLGNEIFKITTIILANGQFYSGDGDLYKLCCAQSFTADEAWTIHSAVVQAVKVAGHTLFENSEDAKLAGCFQLNTQKNHIRLTAETHYKNKKLIEGTPLNPIKQFQF